MLRPENKKVSKEFLAYLKDTPMIPAHTNPIAKKQKSLENPSESFSRRVLHIQQGDISEICSSYVLENNRLRKKSILYGPHQKFQQNQQAQLPDENQKIELIKERAKLEYLEKKGYLKEEEKKKLQRIRSNQELSNFKIEQKITYQPNQVQNYQKVPEYYQDMQSQSHYIQNENFNPNIQMHYGADMAKMPYRTNIMKMEKSQNHHFYYKQPQFFGPNSPQYYSYQAQQQPDNYNYQNNQYFY